MCLGESWTDSLDRTEEAALRTATWRDLPSYAFALHTNDDAITWAVLEPPAARRAMPRFTICRIAPSLLVMVQDAADRRRFISVPHIDDAIVLIRQTALEAVIAAHNIHALPTRAQ